MYIIMYSFKILNTISVSKTLIFKLTFFFSPEGLLGLPHWEFQMEKDCSLAYEWKPAKEGEAVV